MMNPIKVDGIPYSVVTSDDLGDSYGEINYQKCIIKIRPGLIPHSHNEVLLHELIHAISTHRSLGLTEQQVTALSTGIIGILYNNPEFLDAISRRVRYED